MTLLLVSSEISRSYEGLNGDITFFGVLTYVRMRSLLGRELYLFCRGKLLIQSIDARSHYTKRRIYRERS